MKTPRKPKSDQSPSSKGRVYSYIRFSTPDQASGRSEPRQTELAAAYASAHGLEFDQSLRMADRGTSAFKGDNVKFGALGAFLDEVKQGRVPAGSVLIVENIDRITRLAFWDAFEVLSGIIRKGIKIHTTAPEMTYDEDCAKDGRIYALVGQVNLAHDESNKKSSRIKDAWANLHAKARSEKRPESLTCPKWLEAKTEVVDGRKRVTGYEPIPLATAAVRAIFAFRLRGQGGALICRRLNTEGYWTPAKTRKNGQAIPSAGDRWHESYIDKILCNRAVIGEFQPHSKASGERVPVGEPIAGFYPAIIPRGIFDQVQELLKANQGKGRGGRVGKAYNLFTRIVKCAYCGSPMAHQPKGPPPKGKAYLVCDAGRSGRGCGKSHSVRYDEFQETILNNCASLRPEIILPNENAQAQKCEELRTSIASAEARVRGLSDEIENFENLAGRVKSASAQDAYESKAQQRRNERDELRTSIASDSAALVKAERSRASIKKWVSDLEDLKRAISGDTSKAVEARIALKEHLRDLIEKVEIYASGFRERGQSVDADPGFTGWPKFDASAEEKKRWRAQVRKLSPSTTNEIECWLDEVLHELTRPLAKAERWNFTQYVISEAMSKKGRFYRVHFTTGIIHDFVPPGSIAMGTTLIRKAGRTEDGEPRWRFISPPLDVLWKRFKNSRPSKTAYSRRTQ